MAHATLIYTVEPDGRIAAIEGPWDQFAVENNGQDIERDEVLGTNLFSHIHGEGVKEAYRTMHQYLLDNSEQSLEFDYRCDSRDARRNMHMLMENREGILRYESTLLEIIHMDKPVEIDYGRKNDNYVLMCSWCKQIKHPTETENWNPLDKLFELAREPFMVTHGICPSCRDQFPYLDLDSIKI